MKPLEIGTLVPGGILPTDRWHVGRDDGSCSRCGVVRPDEDVPLSANPNKTERGRLNACPSRDRLHFER
jgi:hypothetical protein